MRFNCLKVTELLQRDSLLFTTEYSFDQPPRKDKTLSWLCTHLVVLDLSPMDRESSILTTTPLLQESQDPSFCEVKDSCTNISKFGRFKNPFKMITDLSKIHLEAED